MAQQVDVGAVGGLAYDDGSLVHHGGYWFTPHFAERAYFSYPMRIRGQRAVLETVHEISAIGPDCVMIRRETFLDAGGFDTTLDEPWHMVELCLRLRAKGLSVLLNPHVMFWDFDCHVHDDRWRLRTPRGLRERWPETFVNDPYRPLRPLRESPESRRPLWQPQRLRQLAKSRADSRQ